MTSSYWKNVVNNSLDLADRALAGSSFQTILPWNLMDARLAGPGRNGTSNSLVSWPLVIL